MNNEIAVIGTGLVGQELCKILAENHIRSGDFLAVSRSMEDRRDKGCVSIETALRRKPRYVFMAVNAETTRELVPKFRKIGATIIDKSDAFRMDEDVPLIVPEVNGQLLNGLETLVASPNCTTIQLVMALAPIEEIFPMKRVIVSTYQSVSGSGKEALAQLEAERRNERPRGPYPHPIDENLIPACDDFLPNGYTKEEEKIVNETRRILRGKDVRISATTVRVPIPRCHGISVNIEFEDEFDIPNIRKQLSYNPGVLVYDDPTNNVYPMPSHVTGSDKVYVGRIRRDTSAENALNLWIVADNLRKGAALNAWQILESIRKVRGDRS